MKKQTAYQNAKKTAKKLSKKSFQDEYIKLLDKVCASIIKSMGAIGFDIVDPTGTGEQGKLDFLAYKEVVEKNIVGITKKGKIIFLNEDALVFFPIRKCIIDGDISLENAIEVDDELRLVLS